MAVSTFVPTQPPRLGETRASTGLFSLLASIAVVGGLLFLIKKV